jgi:hypothetical protein
MSQPLITTGDRRPLIAANDPALGNTDRAAYRRYVESGDESILSLRSEPVRYEVRGMTVRERLYCRGIQVQGNLYLWALAVLRCVLCGVSGARRADALEEKKVPEFGMLLLPDDVVFEACGHDEDTVWLLGLMASELSEPGAEVGKG